MGEAIGQFLPMAVGVAISPFPIVGVVLMLDTARARVNAPAFILGTWLGLGIVGTIVLLFASGADASEQGAPATWVDVLKLVLGLLLLGLALQQWRGRPRAGETAATPKWMSTIDQFTPLKAAAAGVLLSGVNPKNLLLAAAAAAAIAQTGISASEQALAYVVFILIGSIGVATPTVIYFALGDRSREPLDRLKSWMTQNNAVIMTVVLLVIAAKIIGDAIAGFST